MKYAAARPTIKSGDLLAFTHRSWRTWKDIKIQLVRLATQSEYSHVGIAWVPQGGRVFVLEAVTPCTRIFPLSLSGDFYHLGMDAPWYDCTEEFALSHIGVEYSQRNAVRAFFKPLEKGNVSECAAYVREVLLVDGINLGDMSRPDAVVQAALARGARLNFINNGTTT